MKISGINKILDVYKTNATNKVEKVSKVKGKKDVLSISNAAKDFQTAKTAISKLPDIREEKVETIKQGLQSGTYNVSAQEVSEKMIDDFFDQRI